MRHQIGGMHPKNNKAYEENETLMHYYNYKATQDLRREQWKDYCYNINKKGLLNWANKNIPGAKDNPRTAFTATEAFSRVMATKAILAADSGATITQKPLYHHYDLDVTYSDGTKEKIETKFRLNDKDQYDTSDVSYKKTEWEENQRDKDNTSVLITYWDNSAVKWNMFDYTSTSSWTHSATTAIDADAITEQKVQYDFSTTDWYSSPTNPLYK